MKTRNSHDPSRESAARTSSAQGIRRWVAAGILTALVLAVVAGAILQASPAEAQNPFRILVSNSGHSAELNDSFALDADFPRHAQRFTTGSDAPGYTLETILIGFYRIADRSAPGGELTVTLNEESNGNPGTALCTLIDPSNFGGFGMHTFSAPMGMGQCPGLRANTTYFAVIERANLDTSAIELSVTSTYGGDSHSVEGWLIGNGAHRYVSANTPPWTPSSDSPNLFFRVHGVGIPHPPRVAGFDLHSDNDNPKGIWGNDDTFWVSQNGTTDKLFGYNRSDGSRDSSQDFNTLTGAGNERPTGICSDGTTMFVADYDDNKVYAYTVSTKAHDSTKDITLASGNTKPEGVWCDVTNVWVVEDDSVPSNEIFAYNRVDGTQNTDVDFPDLDPTVNGSPLNANPRDIYSNGETMFVVDDEDATVYAWKMSDQTRDPDKEIALDGDNEDPEGLWFDGRVLWVVDDADDRVYVYDLPGAQPDNTVAEGVPAVRTPTSQDVWTATLTAGTHGLFGEGYIAGSNPITGSLSPGATFTLDGDTYTVTNLYTALGDLVFGLDKEPPREFTLSVAGESFVSVGRRSVVAGAAYGYIWHDVGFAWAASDTVSVVLSVDYVPKKGGELTADVSGIMDSEDGVANAFFHYQWVRVDGTDETELDGETGLTYTPTDEDGDKHLKVRVIFDDDAGNKEYPLTSPQVGPVGTNGLAAGAPSITGAPRAGETLTVDLSGITDPEGTDAAEFTYQWIRIDGDSEADIPNATRATYRPTDEDADKQIKVKVSFTDNEGFQEGPFTTEPTATIVAADVLVKNTGQDPAVPTYALSTTTSKRAHAFTTGPDTVGYELHSVGFRFANIASTSNAGTELTATLHQTSGNDPGTELCTLDDPASFSASGVNTFTAPTSGNNRCPKLTHSTTYFVVLTRANNNTSTITLSVTNSNAEDAGSSDGWTISNNRSQYSGTSWAQSVSQSYMIEVKGDTAAAPIVSGHRTWVDNRQGVASTNYENTGTFTIAQGFRTGDTVGIYEVHEIHVDLDGGQPETETIKVGIVESTAPDDYWEYATPFHFERGGNYEDQTVPTDGVHTFRRTSGNSALKANTNYFLVIESTSNDPANAAIVRMTQSEAETSDDGWTVDDYSHSKRKQDNATWTKQDHQVRFRISGSFREGIGMAGDSYGFESCVELRRGERTNCIVAIAVSEPADPANPPPNVSKSNLDLSHEAFADWIEFTGWWQWMHQTVDFPVTMHPLPTGSDSVTMSYGSRGYTARSGHDYWNTQGSITFNSTSNHTQTVRVQIIDDGLEDSGETFSFYLYRCQDQDGDSCDDQFADSSVDGIIYNTEESAEIAYLEVSDVTVTEADGATAEFTVSLTAPTTAAVYFDYTTEDGTAKDGIDYTGGSGTAFLANGDTSVTISVPISNDEVWTGNRSFTLKISEAVYAGISDDSGKATIRDDEPQPLRAYFNDMPAGHNGKHNFTFNISFNQNVATQYLVMQNDAMTVTNGHITRAERIDGQRDFWGITVQPDSGADVTVHLPATTDCSATGAVCTGGDQPQALSNSVTQTFVGTALNVRLASNANHNGKDAFTAELIFSEETDTTAAELKDHALTTQGGSITSVAAKTEGSTRAWNVTLQPSGLGHLTMTLTGATDCATDGHVCTPGGELLSHALIKKIYGPVQLSISDAATTEGEGATLTFTVTAENDTVDKYTVSYATSDGTATAGEDYTATSGVLAYTYGAGPLTVSVPVLSDDETESAETVTLTLSNPSQYVHIKDGQATGTIAAGVQEQEEETQANSAPTGLPSIPGTPKAGEPLTADTSAINDADGLTGVTYSYQWVRTTGGEDEDIGTATGASYTPDNNDVDKTLKVRVSFEDDAGNDESLTSLPTAAVARSADGTVWSADMLVTEYGETSIGAATADLFSNIGGSSELQIRSLWSYTPDKDLRLAFAQGVANADNYTLLVGGLTLEFPVGSSGNGSFKWTNVDVGWQEGDTIAVSIVPTSSLEEAPANTAATGEPAISGTPQVGLTLTADTSAISDADGTETAVFEYQWLAGGAEIQSATRSAHTLTTSEVGKTIKVKISFTDDRNNAESLTSGPTTAVAANVPTAPRQLTASTGDQAGELDAAWQPPSSTRGAAITGYKVQWKLSAASWDTQADISETTVTVTTHTITGLTAGAEYAVRVSAKNRIGEGPAAPEATGTAGGETATEEDTAEEDPAQEEESPEPEPANSAPTGLPTVSGTPQVEKTLTASTSEINDPDGLTNVSYGYQWIRSDNGADTDIAGENDSTYTLVFADQGKTIKVKVSFTDDADNAETLTSVATVAVAAAPNREATGKPAIGGTPQVEETLTADTANIADEDGLDNVSYSYQWIAGGSDIDGATSSTYILTASEQGQTIQVRVTFTDDRDNAETLTSIATAEVAAAPEPLTVRLKVAAPTSHDGSSEFTFEIEFSEEFGLSYVTLKSHAFNVTGGSVEKAQRTDKPSNITWLITVKPASTGDVTIELPATTDCDAQGAICTGDGRKLSNSLNFTVSGPGQ